MTRWSMGLSVLSMCLACGAHSEDLPSEPVGGMQAAGAGGFAPADAGDSSGGVAASANQSAGSTSGFGGDSAGAMSDAGEPGYVPYVDSGTRNCENENYCFGLTCYAPPSFEPNVCVARCKRDLDCEPFEACIGSARLEPTCYARCDSPSDCAHHFDCLDFARDGQLVCFPTSWATHRDDLGD